MFQKKDKPVPNDLNGAIFFLALAVKHYKEAFSRNGAVKLNRMLHVRSCYSQEDSFALIADALAMGVLVFDKKAHKSLVVDDEVFKVWRESFSHNVYTFQTYVASPKWPLVEVRRNLTVLERECLIKNIMKGRLFQDKVSSELAKNGDDNDWSVL
jgi:hypothetical protein